MSTLDTGTLARYCDCELSYVAASAQKAAWLSVCKERMEAIFQDGKSPDGSDDKLYEAAKEQVDFWTSQLAKFEKMARSCATELGMTISSRCRLVVPNVKKEPVADPLALLQKKFQAG